MPVPERHALMVVGGRGKVTINPDGPFTCQPEPEFIGTYKLLYRASNAATLHLRTKPGGEAVM